ncbi:M48 family metallopeptidase [Massilia sp. G4R7]|uniref:M48 family metallopeptidase n=1 Tax=Massilia phyllostachyos TaxID=2898585 RepID=A0ABS8Q241_9BURK|nr:M48 family metallopeptidase [Massilia phyllostachyos]MCD2515819.1 M48 family metallopeptidase [Massilia phyllostachyos]
MSAAHYFDGHSARLHVVQLSTGNGAIHLHGEAARSYSLAGARLAEPFAHSPAVLYFKDGSHVEVPDPAMHPMLMDVLGYRKSWVVRWQDNMAASLAALALLLALIAATWFWGLPAAAERLSRHVPPSADHAIGSNALALLERQGFIKPSRLSEDRQADLQALFQRVQPPGSRIPLRLRLADTPLLGPNALAFPDGTIVLTDQLVGVAIEKQSVFDAHAAAMLAGVLAHEIGHIEMRHSVRSMTRASLTAALSATLFGDFSAVAAGMPALLGNMKYSREMELAADDYAAATLKRRGISTLPLADLFDDVEEATEEAMPAMFRQAMTYASTHPDGHARSRRLRATEPEKAEQTDQEAEH